MFDQPSKAIDEQKAVGQTGQWVGNFSFCDVGLRAGHTQGLSCRVTNCETPAEHPPEAPIFVQHTMLALEMWSQLLLMSGNFVFDTISVRIMNAFEPLLG